MGGDRTVGSATWRAVGVALAASVVVTVVALRLGDTVTEHFDEGGLVTWYSTMLLLALAMLAARTWRHRRDDGGPATLWLLASGGFAFLATDEVFGLHEELDQLLHDRLLGAPQSWTTVLDDLIVAAYGALAAVTLVRYRGELTRVPALPPLLATALVLLVLDVAIDVAGHRETLGLVVARGPFRRRLLEWLMVAEESLKILVEGIVLIGVWLAARHAALGDDATPQAAELVCADPLHDASSPPP